MLPFDAQKLIREAKTTGSRRSRKRQGKAGAQQLPDRLDSLGRAGRDGRNGASPAIVCAASMRAPRSAHTSDLLRTMTGCAPLAYARHDITFDAA